MKKMIVLYFCVLALFSFFTYTFIDPNLIYLHTLYTGFAFSHRVVITIFYSLFICLLFVFYGYFSTHQKELEDRYQKILLGITILLGLFAYPAFVSYDIFNYIATAKVVFFYHENPYLLMPIQFLHEPLLLFMHAPNKTALYGFIWILLTGIPFLVGIGNFLITLFAFKMFVIVFYVITVLLLYKLSKNLQTVLLFALNPLVIIETLMSGHNDIVMMCFALFAVYLLQQKKILSSIIVVIASVFIKYATGVLLPVLLFVSFVQKKKETIDWDTIYSWFSGLLFVVFLLSAFREEIYPWYAQWFLLFAVLSKKSWIRSVGIAFSFSILFRDIPFMLLGTYFGITPFIKTSVTFAIPFAVTMVIVGKYIRRNLTSGLMSKVSI